MVSKELISTLLCVHSDQLIPRLFFDVLSPAHTSPQTLYLSVGIVDLSVRKERNLKSESTICEVETVDRGSDTHNDTCMWVMCVLMYTYLHNIVCMYVCLLEVTKQQMCMKYCSSVLHYQLQGSY